MSFHNTITRTEFQSAMARLSTNLYYYIIKKALSFHHTITPTKFKSAMERSLTNLYYYIIPIQSFNALADILHEFHGVNGCSSNHVNPDAKSLKVHFLEANYICKVTWRTERKNNDV